MPDTVSKTQKIAEAAKLRTRVEREAQEGMNPDPTNPNEMTDEELEGKQEFAAERVAIRPQSTAQSLTGELDPNAMGDVKGDGGDAKNYPDSDPDKALGVPTYEHGLRETRLGADALDPAIRTVFGQQQSARTQAEIDRGRKALSGRKTTPNTTRKGRTVVTDASDDPDGDKGRERVEAAAAKAKAEVAAKVDDAKTDDKTDTTKKSDDTKTK